MKFHLNKKYLSYILYVSLGAIAVFICYGIISNFDTIFLAIANAIGVILGLLKPLIIGIVIAYLLYPITKFLGRIFEGKLKLKKHSHLISVIFTYISIVVLIVLLIYATYAIISGEVSHNKNISYMVKTIEENIPKYEDVFEYIDEKIGESGLSVDTKSYLKKSTEQISKYATMSVDGIFQFSKSAASVIVNWFLGLCISFYLLKDYQFFKRKYKENIVVFIKPKKVNSINSTLREIDDVISKFIRGQMLDALFVGVISSIGLSIIGLKFAVPIGMIAGFGNLIPYVGPIIGCIPAIAVGILSPDPIIALWAVLVFFIVQQIDNTFINPKIVGTSTGHNPVLVIMAVAIGGSLGGIFGMFISVPLLGIIKLFVVKFIDRKKEKIMKEEIKTID